MISAVFVDQISEKSQVRRRWGGSWTRETTKHCYSKLVNINPRNRKVLRKVDIRNPNYFFTGRGGKTWKSQIKSDGVQTWTLFGDTGFKNYSFNSIKEDKENPYQMEIRYDHSNLMDKSMHNINVFDNAVVLQPASKADRLEEKFNSFKVKKMKLCDNEDTSILYGVKSMQAYKKAQNNSDTAGSKNQLFKFEDMDLKKEKIIDFHLIKGRFLVVLCLNKICLKDIETGN